MIDLRAVLSKPVPLVCVIGVGFTSLFAGACGRLIVGEEYHHLSLLVGFLMSAGLALFCADLAQPTPIARSGTEYEEREKEAHQANMERHAALMEAHRLGMDLKRLESKRLRQLIRQDRPGWEGR